MTTPIWEKQVWFKCRTCDYYNHMELGMPNFKERVIEFGSFTDAQEHLIETNIEHDIIAFVKDND